MGSYILHSVLAALLANLVTAVIKVDPSAVTAFNEVSSGSKRYALFQLSADSSSVGFLKSAASSASFSDLSKDLEAAKAAGEARFAFFLVPAAQTKATTKAKDELLYVVWAPLSAKDTVRDSYKQLYDDFKDALKADVWVEVLTGSADDLNLDSICESRQAGYYSIESVEYYFDYLETVTTEEIITIETTCITSYNNVFKGTNRYAIYAFSSDLSSLSLVKEGSGSAEFADLISDLEGQNDARYAIYSTSVTIGGKTVNKLIFILWLPATISDKVRLFYTTKVSEFRDGLKGDFWYEYTATSSSELDLKNIINLGLGGEPVVPAAEKPKAEVEATVDAGAVTTYESLVKGTFRYVLFKLNADFSALVVDKTAPLSATFTDFIADLIHAQSANEGRYAVYLAPVTISGQAQTQLIFFNWIPLNVQEKIRLLYQKYVIKFKQALSASFYLEINANSAAELNLDAILKATLGTEVESQGSLGGEVLGQMEQPETKPDSGAGAGTGGGTEIKPDSGAGTGTSVGTEIKPDSGAGVVTEAEVPDVTLTANDDAEVKKLFKALKRFVIFGFKGDSDDIEMKSSGELTASFDDFVAQLKAAKKAGEGRFGIFSAPVPMRGRIQNKLMIFIWVPLEIPNKERQRYMKRFAKFKKALGQEFWLESTVISEADLNLKSLVKTGAKGNLADKAFGKHKRGPGFNPLGWVKGGHGFGDGESSEESNDGHHRGKGGFFLNLEGGIGGKKNKGQKSGIKGGFGAGLAIHKGLGHFRKGGKHRGSHSNDGGLKTGSGASAGDLESSVETGFGKRKGSHNHNLNGAHKGSHSHDGNFKTEIGAGIGGDHGFGGHRKSNRHGKDGKHSGSHSHDGDLKTKIGAGLVKHRGSHSHSDSHTGGLKTKIGVGFGGHKGSHSHSESHEGGLKTKIGVGFGGHKGSHSHSGSHDGGLKTKIGVGFGGHKGSHSRSKDDGIKTGIKPAVGIEDGCIGSGNNEFKGGIGAAITAGSHSQDRKFKTKNGGGHGGQRGSHSHDGGIGVGVGAGIGGIKAGIGAGIGVDSHSQDAKFKTKIGGSHSVGVGVGNGGIAVGAVKGNIGGGIGVGAGAGIGGLKGTIGAGQDANIKLAIGGQKGGTEAKVGVGNVGGKAEIKGGLKFGK